MINYYQFSTKNLLHVYKKLLIWFVLVHSYSYVLSRSTIFFWHIMSLKIHTIIIFYSRFKQWMVNKDKLSIGAKSFENDEISRQINSQSQIDNQTKNYQNQRIKQMDRNSFLFLKVTPFRCVTLERFDRSIIRENLYKLFLFCVLDAKHCLYSRLAKGWAQEVSPPTPKSNFTFYFYHP